MKIRHALTLMVLMLVACFGGLYVIGLETPSLFHAAIYVLLCAAAVTFFFFCSQTKR